MTALQTMDGRDAAYREENSLTSVVSYPQRCSLWGDGRYPGNCDGRLFKNLVLRYGAKVVADPMMGSGTTRDVVEGLNRHLGSDITFWGNDLRHGFNLLNEDLPGPFDFVWLHPPYWNIVRYNEGNPADLSNLDDYAKFRAALEVCVLRCACALITGGRLAVLIGDVRRRGQYTSIMRDVLALEEHIGELRSVVIKAQHNCRSDRKSYGKMEDLPIKHEYCLIFKKR